MHKKQKALAWVAWGISFALLLYDRGVRGLGWLAGPADFGEYVTTPWRAYVWPYLRDRAFPMINWEALLFAAATLTLAWVYAGDRARKWLKSSRQRHWNPPRSEISNSELGELCVALCREIHDYIAHSEEIYGELRDETWSDDIKNLQERANADKVRFRKLFGARLFYLEDALLRKRLRRLALDEQTLDYMDERARLADEIGALGLRLLAGRGSPIDAWNKLNRQ